MEKNNQTLVKYEIPDMNQNFTENSLINHLLPARQTEHHSFHNQSRKLLQGPVGKILQTAFNEKLTRLV